MLTRPALSLNESQLIVGKKTPDGFHEVVNVTFRDTDGSMKHGYKKPCDNNSYPPLLAKYVAAFSVFVRAALGDKASEDRLLYNDAGKIIGTVSIEVPNFVHLLAQRDPDYKDPEKQKLANPDKQMLLQKNVAALLVSAYKHKNNDLHPGNISVNGLIDWDELYNELTSIIKGERFGSGVLFESPKISTDVKEQDLRTFPRVGTRIHWPANYIPKNWNLLKAYKTGAFLELEGDREFIHQYFTAILKELLSFDKKMIAKRMNLYLGNEKLNLHELPFQKRRALLEFGKASKLFHNDQGSERDFIEHCLLYFENEHNKFKNIVLNMPEFREFLIILNKNPAEILQLKKWFISQNTKNTIPYSLDFIDEELHTLWRECFKAEFDKDMQILHDSILLSKASPLYSIEDPKNHEITHEQLSTMISTLTKQDVVDESKASISIKQDAKPEEISLLRNIIHLKIQNQAIHLYDQIMQLKSQYYAKLNATIKDNHAFIEDIKKTIIENEAERNSLNQWLSESIDKSKHKKEIEFFLDSLIYDMKEVFSDIDKFNIKLQETLVAFHMNHTIIHLLPPLTIKYSSKVLEQKQKSHSGKSLAAEDDYDFISSDKITIEQLSKLLSIWISPEKEALIKKLVHETFTQDYDARSKGMMSGLVYNFFRTRGDEVKSMSLTQIFSTGKWNSTSLNTLLIKKLCITMLTQEKSDPFMKSIHDKISAHDDTWWSIVALDIAIKSHLKHASKESSASATPVAISH